MMNRERQEKENVSQLQPDMAKAKEGVRQGVGRASNRGLRRFCREVSRMQGLGFADVCPSKWNTLL